jgi:DNA polymerase-3 subunit epsilon
MVNGIYEGYGYIEKDENILNENELLSKLIFQENNYETTRTLALLEKNIRKEHILQL